MKDVIDKWDTLSTKEKRKYYHGYKLPLYIIEKEWDNLSETDRLRVTCFQELSVGFIIKILNDIPPSDLVFCLRYQPCLQNIAEEDLPTFLTHSNDSVREWAAKIYDKRFTICKNK